ncbi:MAG: hypothetical protein GXP62_01675 [Oligoflexia bacterium]|nr:hypothetical protein [Oligoflexia bacterium]
MIGLICSCNAHAKTCADLAPGSERDLCYFDDIKLLPPSAINTVVADAQQIVDPMVQGAAVSSWVSAHNNQIALKDGRALCDLLVDRDYQYCTQQLTAAHLRR